MIGAVNSRVYLSLLDVLKKLPGNEEIVDAPADVAVTRSRKEVPVGVGPGPGWILIAPDIDIACSNDLIDPGPLFGQEAGVIFVRFRTSKVNGLMGSIHIATEDDWLVLAELLSECEEGVIEAELIVDPVRALAAIGEVAVNKPKVRELGRYETALVIKFWDTHAIEQGNRLYFRIDGDTTITLFDLAGGEVGGETGEVPKPIRKLVGRSFGLLEAEDVRLYAFQEGLPERVLVFSKRAEAVHVP